MAPLSRAARRQDILGKTMRTRTAEKNSSSQLARRCMATYDRLSILAEQSILYSMESEPVGEGSSG
jgi:hypothetical protein